MGQIVSDVTDILDYKNNKSEIKKQRQQILKQIAADETEKNNLVKKVLATQRAKYGAGGVKSDGVSSGAVLRRLTEETAAPYREKRRNNLNKIKNLSVKKPNLIKTLLSRFDELMG